MKAPLYLCVWEIATIEADDSKDFPLLLPSNKELVIVGLGGAARRHQIIISLIEFVYQCWLLEPARSP